MDLGLLPAPPEQAVSQLHQGDTRNCCQTVTAPSPELMSVTKWAQNTQDGRKEQPGARVPGCQQNLQKTTNDCTFLPWGMPFSSFTGVSFPSALLQEVTLSSTVRVCETHYSVKAKPEDLVIPQSLVASVLLCALTWKVLVLQWDRGNAPRLGREGSDQRGPNRHVLPEVRESSGQKLRL